MGHGRRGHIGCRSVWKAGNWRIPTAEFKEKSGGPLGRETGVMPVPVGEFTAMFRSPRAVDPVPQAINPIPPIPEPNKPVPPADPKPDEPKPPAPAHAGSGSGQEPGEFTRMFQLASQQKDTKGEVTRMFEVDQRAAERMQPTPSKLKR